MAGKVGRKRKNIPVKIISDTLRKYKDIGIAAEVLNCSRGYIYQELGKKGLKPLDVIGR